MEAVNDNIKLVDATTALKILGDAGVTMQRITLQRNFNRHARKIFGRIYYPRQEIEMLLAHERAA